MSGMLFGVVGETDCNMIYHKRLTYHLDGGKIYHVFNKTYACIEGRCYLLHVICEYGWDYNIKDFIDSYKGQDLISLIIFKML